MSLNKKLFHKAAASATDTFEPTKNFNTVLYTGTGATQKVGAYINQGGEFNGSNSIITLPNSITSGLGAFGVSFFIKNQSLSGQNILFYFNNGVIFGVDLEASGNQRILFSNSSGNITFNITANFTTNTWQHFVLTGNTTNGLKAYIDGTEVGSTSWDGTHATGTGSNTIGHNGSSPDATIDQFRFFNRYLTTSNIATLRGETFNSSTKSTTDIFGDRSGIALYQFENNANDTGGASGYLNEGAIFNGSDSTIIIPNTDLFNTTSRLSFSVSFWFKSTSTGSNALVTDYPPVSGNYAFYITLESGVLKCGNFYSGGYSGVQAGTTTVNDGNWHHAVLVNNTSDNTQKVYLDGNSTPEISTSLTTGTKTSQNLVVGFFYGVSYYYSGILDELRVYSDVLTTTEIGYIYNNTTASIPTDNLTAYFKFNGTFQDEQQSHDGIGSNVTFRYDGTASNVTFQGATRFTPDWVWAKRRSDTEDNVVFDSVRGVQKQLRTNETGVESTKTNAISSFNSNGFTTGSNNALNTNNETYVAWCWKGGGAAVTNDTGSRDTQVSANTAAGFSIVSLNKPDLNTDTYGHGLTSAPEMIILKRYESTASSDDWHVYHKDLGNTVRISLDSSNQKVTGTGVWGSTTPTISDFTLQNQTGGLHIAYCMHSVDNYQKIGSFTGNGSAVGPIVDTGFEVAWLLIKRTDANGTNWRIIDNKRDTTNPRANYINADTNEAEETAYDQVDFLTNGFQLATTDTSINNNGSTMIYWAIAADPSTASTPSVTNAFDVVTYSGTGAAQDILTDCNADFAWIKSTSHDTSHELHDTVRGEPSRLSTDSTAADPETANGFVNFIDKGFSLDGTGGGGEVNASSRDYIAFLWSAGAHEGLLPTANTDGAVDSIVSVNDAAGFSIIKWTSDGGSTATTKGHGMSAAVDFAIVKSMDSNSIWMIFHKDLPQNKYIQFTDDALSPDGGVTYFTTSTTTLGFRDASNSVSGDNMIAYAWREISGYSSVGTYTGSTSGVTITTGFRPRFILVKSTSNVENWVILTSDLGSGNALKANTNTANDVSSRNTFTLSDTGFSFPHQSTADAALNENGYEYIYFAIK